MKISVDDLKKAIKWIESSSKDTHVAVELAYDGRNLSIRCKDKYEAQVEITLYTDSSMLPKIRKEDVLP